MYSPKARCGFLFEIQMCKRPCLSVTLITSPQISAIFICNAKHYFKSRKYSLHDSTTTTENLSSKQSIWAANHLASNGLHHLPDTG